MRARRRRGFGWKRWSTKWLYERLGLYGDYRRGPVAAGHGESAPDRIGHITLHAKQTGKRSAGNPHAAFEEAGTGNVTRGAGLRTNAKVVGATTGPYRRRASPRPDRPSGSTACRVRTMRAAAFAKATSYDSPAWAADAALPVHSAGRYTYAHANCKAGRWRPGVPTPGIQQPPARCYARDQSRGSLSCTGGHIGVGLLCCCRSRWRHILETGHTVG